MVFVDQRVNIFATLDTYFKNDLQKSYSNSHHHYYMKPSQNWTLSVMFINLLG